MLPRIGVGPKDLGFQLANHNSTWRGVRVQDKKAFKVKFNGEGIDQQPRRGRSPLFSLRLFVYMFLRL